MAISIWFWNPTSSVEIFENTGTRKKPVSGESKP